MRRRRDMDEEEARNWLKRAMAVTENQRVEVMIRRRAMRSLPTPRSSRLTASQSSASSDMKDAFPFFKLPAELRVRVYREALVRDTPLLLHLDHSNDSSKSDLLRKKLVAMSLGLASTSYEEINVALLRTSKAVYKEAHQVLYAENAFTLILCSGTSTLESLHQRSRSFIKHVTVALPSDSDILDGFQDFVRLGLRYCWGVKTFTIVMNSNDTPDASLPPVTSTTPTDKSNCPTDPYSIAFHILRFLPSGCKIVLKGTVRGSVRAVVEEEGRLLKDLDEVSGVLCC
ncbi:hypothetical protein K458DRAFT_423270 [Lentithecium fluviatile CBS 122367]|uniref:DUF7730 domain-containing protein n=1 Tax=Lentithecium fluviatile CBS 122367 TaxID=1168545 RepID=A0A6G1IK18_9PLEO|nr:hypothetical protein K458DRAFT_423270 [Lentithecium fluviatile CBS 122367]